MINVRKIVFDSLMEIETGKKSHLVIRQVLDKYDYLSTADKNFIKRLTEGTIQKRICLDYAINLFSEKEVDKLKPAIRQILRMGVYQILFMDRVPDASACDEAVKLVRTESRSEFVGFVNAILRNVSKNKEKCLDYSVIEDTVKRLSIQYSTPEWIVRMFIKEKLCVSELLEAFEKIRPTCVRIRMPEKKEEILSKWHLAGVEFTESRYIENVYLVDGFAGAGELYGFDEGYLYLQDESSMICVKKAVENLPKNPLIIDLCAAPGGKSIFASDLLEGNCQVKAFDVSEGKVRLISENIERMHIDCITSEVGDATVCNESLVGKADLVIADVPCSGLGVIGRKSDIKYNVSNELMRDLCALQKSIVDNAVKYVKPGGVLMYSTCTIHKAENEKMVKYVIENYPEFSLEYEHQLLPYVEETDGFFMARLRKKD